MTDERREMLENAIADKLEELRQELLEFLNETGESLHISVSKDMTYCFAMNDDGKYLLQKTRFYH